MVYRTQTQLDTILNPLGLLLNAHNKENVVIIPYWLLYIHSLFLGEEIYTSPFEFDQVGRNLLTMFFIGIVFFTLNLLVEYNFFIKRG